MCWLLCPQVSTGNSRDICYLLASVSFSLVVSFKFHFKEYEQFSFCFLILFDEILNRKNSFPQASSKTSSSTFWFIAAKIKSRAPFLRL